MKSNKRLNEEIEAVANMWNSHPAGMASAHVFAATFLALRWARGFREDRPTVALEKRLKRMADERAAEGGKG